MNDVKQVIAYTKGSGKDSEDTCGWAYMLKSAISENEEDKKIFSDWNVWFYQREF